MTDCSYTDRVLYDRAAHQMMPHSREAQLEAIARSLHLAGPRAVVRAQRTL